jgi:hypothetical protein
VHSDCAVSQLPLSSQVELAELQAMPFVGEPYRSGRDDDGNPLGAVICTGRRRIGHRLPTEALDLFPLINRRPVSARALVAFGQAAADARRALQRRNGACFASRHFSLSCCDTNALSDRVLFRVVSVPCSRSSWTCRR